MLAAGTSPILTGLFWIAGVTGAITGIWKAGPALWTFVKAAAKLPLTLEALANTPRALEELTADVSGLAGRFETFAAETSAELHTNGGKSLKDATISAAKDARAAANTGRRAERKVDDVAAKLATHMAGALAIAKEHRAEVAEGRRIVGRAETTAREAKSSRQRTTRKLGKVSKQLTDHVSR